MITAYMEVFRGHRYAFLRVPIHMRNKRAAIATDGRFLVVDLDGECSLKEIRLLLDTLLDKQVGYSAELADPLQRKGD